MSRQAWTSVRLFPIGLLYIPASFCYILSHGVHRLPEAETPMVSHASDRHRAYLERSLGAHAAYTLHYPLVGSVRARRPLLVGDIALALRDLLLRVGEQSKINLLALHIEREHVHLLFSLRPEMAVAMAVKHLKGVSSRHLRQAFPHLQALHEDALWNVGYFVRSLGDVNVAQAKAYLDRQREHHGV